MHVVGENPHIVSEQLHLGVVDAEIMQQRVRRGRQHSLQRLLIYAHDALWAREAAWIGGEDIGSFTSPPHT
jgi:hypothetical protein